jgi:exodeoxyribonuclease VII large subunit
MDSSSAASPLQLAALPAGVPLTVTQLNAAARQLIERRLPLLWVAGEVSNLTRAPSGHCYFSLKDERAQVRCVLFRSRFRMLDWAPVNGMQVELRGAPSLYEPRGEFQLTVDYMRRAGLGALFEKFARLKSKLEAEGLFASERKRPLPRFPARVGIVSSPAAAALRDVLSTLARRMPGLAVIVYPTAVQGDGAARQIAAALQLAGARRECQILLLCRGGGSLEDLWAFNEEVVARAIAACPIPVITGVGHETDFTIADFVADLRAPTPTGAAELVSPDGAELRTRMRRLAARLRRAAGRSVGQRAQQLDYTARRLVHPGRRIEERLRQLHQTHHRLHALLEAALQRRGFRVARVGHRLAAARPDLVRLAAEQRQLRARLLRAATSAMQRRMLQLASLSSHLLHLNPHEVLQRGYSIVTTAAGVIVRSSAQLRAQDPVRMEFARGAARARVQDVDP